MTPVIQIFQFKGPIDYFKTLIVNNLITKLTRVINLKAKEFLKPTLAKLLITILIPIPVDIIITHSTAYILDFYWYLLTPIITTYTIEKTYYKFNQFILLWIPFYISACIIDTLYRKVTDSSKKIEN